MTVAIPGQTPERSGYYGHLDNNQQKALDDLKNCLEDDHNIVSEASPVDEPFRKNFYADPAPTFDLELLRFLRARRFDVAKSLDMYLTAMKWRSSVELDTLYANFDYSKAQAAFRLYYPSYMHNTDRNGSPVHIHEISKIDLDGLFKLVTRQEAVQYLYLLSESNLRTRFPACTLHLDENGQNDVLLPVDTVTGIFDLQGVGIRGFWRIKDILYELVQISDNNYPETANKLFVINAPSAFSTVWSYLKGWLDARTASRVFILGSDYQKTLLEYIDSASLPEYLGGSCSCAEREHGCRSGDIGPWNEPQNVD